MSTLKERMDEFSQATGWDVGKIAKEAGVSSSAVSQWLGKGSKVIKSIGIEPATNLEKASGYRAMWLSKGELPKMVAKKESDTETSHGGAAIVTIGDGDFLSDEYIQIRESKVEFSAGNGRTPHFDELEDSVPATYRREWFIKEGFSASTSKRFKVHGDSMEPFLYGGDTVLVNLAETSIVNGKVYALRYGDELKIKRVYKKIDGGLILHSDNPDFLPRDEKLAPATVNEYISIIGRVRDKSGTGGL
jgi:phage repressor protein C with HTH and peptisase S24 domain